MKDPRFGMITLDMARYPERGFFGAGHIPPVYARITLRPGYMADDGRPFAHGKPLLEVEMTMEQFTSLLSMGHVDGGIPCTITQIDGERLEPLPAPPSPAEQAISDLRQKLKRFDRESENDRLFLKELAEKRKIPNWVMDELSKMFERKSQRFVEMAAEAMDSLHAECEKITNEKDLAEGPRL